MVSRTRGGSPSIYPRQVLLRLKDPLPQPLPVLLPPLRLPPSLALWESSHLEELEKEVVLPSVPQSMLWPLKPTPAMMTTMAMSTPSLASWLTLIPRIYLQGILMAILFAICWPKEVPRDLSEDQEGHSVLQGIDRGEEGYFWQWAGWWPSRLSCTLKVLQNSSCWSVCFCLLCCSLLFGGQAKARCENTCSARRFSTWVFKLVELIFL